MKAIFALHAVRLVDFCCNLIRDLPYMPKRTRRIDMEDPLFLLPGIALVGTFVYFLIAKDWRNLSICNPYHLTFSTMPRICFFAWLSYNCFHAAYRGHEVFLFSLFASGIVFLKLYLGVFLVMLSVLYFFYRDYKKVLLSGQVDSEPFSGSFSEYVERFRTIKYPKGNDFTVRLDLRSSHERVVFFIVFVSVIAIFNLFVF